MELHLRTAMCKGYPKDTSQGQVTDRNLLQITTTESLKCNIFFSVQFLPSYDVTLHNYVFIGLPKMFVPFSSIIMVITYMKNNAQYVFC